MSIFWTTRVGVEQVVCGSLQSIVMVLYLPQSVKPRGCPEARWRSQKEESSGSPENEFTQLRQRAWVRVHRERL